MERHEAVHKNLKEIFINNFIGGVAWGLGGTVGISIILAFFGLIMSKINIIPIVGNFVAGVYSFVMTSNPNLFLK